MYVAVEEYQTFILSTVNIQPVASIYLLNIYLLKGLNTLLVTEQCLTSRLSKILIV